MWGQWWDDLKSLQFPQFKVSYCPLLGYDHVLENNKFYCETDDQQLNFISKSLCATDNKEQLVEKATYHIFP